MYNKYGEPHKGLLQSNPQADRVSRKVFKGLCVSIVSFSIMSNSSNEDVCFFTFLSVRKKKVLLYICAGIKILWGDLILL